jgi:hypothetical protein
VSTVAACDAGARETIRRGTALSYTDPDGGNLRIGNYALGTHRPTVLNASQTKIISHFVPDYRKSYVYILPDLTYTL